MIRLFKDLLFAWRYKRAVKEAIMLSQGSGLKYYVLYMNGGLKVVPKQTIKTLVKRQAQEEISGYLRPKYDCDAVFAAEGEKRNHQIVMFTCDIALYHMVSAMPQKMGSDIRKERYERAIKWLEGVQSGKIVPDLPLMLNDDGEMVGSSIVYGCQRKLRHNW